MFARDLGGRDVAMYLARVSQIIVKWLGNEGGIDGKRSGQDKMADFIGNVHYDGQWQNDRYHGRGKLSMTDCGDCRRGRGALGCRYLYKDHGNRPDRKSVV